MPARMHARTHSHRQIDKQDGCLKKLFVTFEIVSWPLNVRADELHS